MRMSEYFTWRRRSRSTQGNKPHGPQWSYEQHRRHEQIEHTEDELPACFSNPHSIDAWRHERMYRHTLPLLACYPNATWMTVGDLYGSDAYFLKARGHDAEPSVRIAHSRLRAGMPDCLQGSSLVGRGAGIKTRRLSRCISPGESLFAVKRIGWHMGCTVVIASGPNERGRDERNQGMTTSMKTVVQ
jgi:hypothetical protein